MEQKITMTDPRKLNYFYEEAIKTLRTNIQFTGKEMKTILFTSCYPDEGKSDILFQLAKEMGKAGKRVLVVDADIRKSAYVKRYRIRQSVLGLSQYLSGQAEVSQVIYTTNFEGVDMILAGPAAPNPSELLGEQAFAELLKKEKAAYDYVLIDTPPMVNLVDAAVVGENCDGAVLVIESGLVSYKVAQKVKEQLQRSGCRILGAVLNKVDIKNDKYYSKYSYYGKYGQ